MVTLPLFWGRLFISRKHMLDTPVLGCSLYPYSGVASENNQLCISPIHGAVHNWYKQKVGHPCSGVFTLPLFWGRLFNFPLKKSENEMLDTPVLGCSLYPFSGVV